VARISAADKRRVRDIIGHLRLDAQCVQAGVLTPEAAVLRFDAWAGQLDAVLDLGLPKTARPDILETTTKEADHGTR
jgi:hypothetical protein